MSKKMHTPLYPLYFLMANFLLLRALNSSGQEKYMPNSITSHVTTTLRKQSRDEEYAFVGGGGVMGLSEGTKVLEIKNGTS